MDIEVGSECFGCGLSVQMRHDNEFYAFGSPTTSYFFAIAIVLVGALAVLPMCNRNIKDGVKRLDKAFKFLCW